EIVDALGPADAAVFAEVYEVSAHGNWEGRTILNRLNNPLLRSPNEEDHLAQMRRTLFARRAQRVRPGWDDEVLADWNGLAIAALVHAARTLDRPEWLTPAATAFAFVLSRMQKEGALVHSYRDGRATAPAIASDYANMIWAALRLLQASNEPAFLTAAEHWC